MKQRILIILPILANLIFGALLLISYFIASPSAVHHGSFIVSAAGRFLEIFYFVVLIVNMLGIPIYYDCLWHRRKGLWLPTIVGFLVSVLCNYTYFVGVFIFWGGRDAWKQSIVVIVVPLIYEILAVGIKKARQKKSIN